MSDDEVVKVLLLGPSRSGKSTLANFLSNQRETPTSKYYPTSPLRILETEVDLETNKFKKNANVFQSDNTRVKRVRVQLWDLGGNAAFQPCWSAVASRCEGLLFVFNPAAARAERELLLWHKQFYFNQQETDDEGNLVKRVHDDCCLVFGHHSTPPAATSTSNTTTTTNNNLTNNNNMTEAADSATAIKRRVAALKGFEAIKTLETSLDYQSENFKVAFDKLVETAMLHRAEREEEEVLQRQREEDDRPQMRL